MHYTGISFFMSQHPRGEWSGRRTYLETKWGLAWLYQCIVVRPMSLQSSRWEWAPMRLSLGITNDPWHCLYVISRGYGVPCVMTLFYFLNFIKFVVMPALAIPCQGCKLQYGIYSKASCNPSNYWQIVILCILNAWHWHIGETHNDFRGHHGWYHDAINSNSLHRICEAMHSNIEWPPRSLVIHQIACRLWYFAFYIHSVGIYGLLIMTLGGIWYC